MTEDDEVWIETHVRSQIDASLDEKLRRLFLAILIMIVGGLGSIIGIGIAWGKQDTKVNSLKDSMQEHHANGTSHMPMKEKIEVFVPRTEMNTILTLQKENIDDIKSAILRIEDKIDKKL